MADVVERAIEPNEIVSALGRDGLTQKEIAATTRVTERTVYAWKHDQGGVRDRSCVRGIA